MSCKYCGEEHGCDNPCCEESDMKNRIEQLEEENEELKENAKERDRLKHELNKAMHPNGDGPKNPSMCDLVAYARSDYKKLAALEKQIQEGELILVSLIPSMMQFLSDGMLSVTEEYAKQFALERAKDG